ncbi:o-succinylbenzoate synthase [Salinibacter grassmerensis]|uniref:o-succinylbenzoate synthase n=1 Tax=Salinibacter grassmerensis TaxID=3040353 RepID=UPI0021E97E09|nr:o-succinylbenzoate synthase [Salinibacter grassmerensis]
MSVTISESALYRYELPLTAPLRLGNEEVTRRRGVLVWLATEQGPVGWGDAAPLPGFSDETVADVEEHARTALPRWTGTSLFDAQAGLDATLQELPFGADAPSSFRFAVESAVVSAAAAIHETSVPEMMGTPRQTVALNALLPRSGANGPAQAVRRQEEGYQAIKVKVGAEGVEEDAARVRAIREALDASVSVRADANRAWSLAEAVTFAEGTDDLDIAYVEEPLADPASLGDLVERTDLPVALDETTREAAPPIMRDLPDVSAVVLKPTLLGGLRHTREWGRAARETGATPVLSASYESGVGIQMLVALAASGPEVPVGLSTYDRLAADVYAPPLPLGGPSVDVPSVVTPSTSRIARDRLDLVERFSA